MHHDGGQFEFMASCCGITGCLNIITTCISAIIYYVCAQGQDLTRVTIVRYTVSVGDDICNVVDLAENQLYCRPPEVRPKKRANDTFCDADARSLQVGYNKDIINMKYKSTIIWLSVQSSTMSVYFTESEYSNYAIFGAAHSK